MATKRRRNPDALAPGEIAPEIIAEAPQAEAATPEETSEGSPTTIANMDLTEEQMPDNTPTVHKWPEVTERREVVVRYSEEDRSELAGKMSKIVMERERTKLRAKNAAAAYKSEVDDLDEELSEIAKRIEAGGEERSVECKWEFETSGMDAASGGLVYHPEFKTLVRVDTGEIVTTIKITDHERQMDLALLHESPPTEGEAATEDEGAADLTDDGDDIGAGPPISDPFPEDGAEEKAESAPYFEGWEAYDNGLTRQDHPLLENWPQGHVDEWLRGWDASKAATAE